MKNKTGYIVSEKLMAQLDDYFINHKDPIFKIAWKNLKDAEVRKYTPPVNITNTRLFKAAKSWWGMHRPCKYTLKQHLDNPGINMPDTAGEKLGIEIAKLIKKSDRK